MKLKRKFRLLALTALLGLSTVVPAQDSREITPAIETVTAYDPISAMLDSLVTLTHVIRYNQLDANCFDPNAVVPGSVPSFSDAVYTERINAIHSPIPLSYNRHVKEFIDLYAIRKRGLTQRVMGLSNLYFPLYEEILDKEGLPLEFKYLSIVESALNPVAVSPVGATGLWQFMYTTGIIYDLKVTSYTDDRRDPIKATHAACQYFKDMYRIYNDWLLVIAAYNCGAGNVNKAIKRSGGKTNFWEIMQYLPAETRGYVPAFIAVTYVMNYSREHNLYPVSPAYNYFEVDTVTVDRPVNFNVLARTLDLPADVISYLNPIYKRGVIPDVGANYVLRLPSNKMAQYLSLQEQIFAESIPPARPVAPSYNRNRYERDEETTASAENGTVKYETVTKRVKKVHTVRKGENLSAIAGKYDMTVGEVKKLNRLRSSAVRKGQKLNVYAYVKTKVPVKVTPAENVAAKKDTGHKDSSALQAQVVNTNSTNPDQQVAEAQSTEDQNKNAESNRPRFIYHVVQPGDTLWNIAKRYDGVTVEMIKDINNLRNADIKPGTKLKVIVAS
jgi:membrane-bound lytic murein transglycosylase D